MTIVQFPQGDLVAAPITVKVERGVNLQDMYDVPTVHPVKVVHKCASGTVQPWTPWRGALKFFSILVESDLIDLREIIVLARQDPVPVNTWIGNMYFPEVGCHGACHNIHSTFW